LIVGIDLGTTHSLVAAWTDGRPRLIPNALGDVLTPSCVSLDDDGQVLVGRAARDRLQTHPQLSAALFKRYMGSGKTLRLGSRDYRAEELSSLVLRSLKADAEAALGGPVDEAVITVPAYFSDAQRKATRVAGQLAGLKVDRLLNEPTAAALAYGLHQAGAESQFLVFDLGGGTFDVSILEMFEGVMEVRASAGDNMLGGEDFALVIVQAFFEDSGIDATARQDPAFMQRLTARAEQLKRQLTGQGEARFEIPWQGQPYTFAMDTKQFEKRCENLLSRLWRPIERALRDARIRAADLDNVVLAGGATRMPMVRALVTRMFGRFPAVTLNPDEVVAMGAAVQAGLKMKDAALDEMVMTDVCPYTLGTSVSRGMDDGSLVDGFYSPIIERNTIVPVSRVHRYGPTRDGQRTIHIAIYQGESRMVRDNIPLGALQVPIAPGSIADGAVDVRFTYDANGLLEVEVTVVRTGEQYHTVVENSAEALSPEQLGERLAALTELKIHPRDTLENRSLMAHGERLYEQLLGTSRDQLGDAILRFEQALASQDGHVVAKHGSALYLVIDTLERDGFLEPALADR
jgi:molecular chaperone HscC